VKHDVEHIESLTKNDLIAFYDNFITPSSPARAKIAVHLLAQNDATAAISQIVEPEAKLQLIIRALTQFLDAQGIPTNKEQLARRLKGVDLNLANPVAFIAAMRLHLVEDAKMPDAQAQQVVEQGLLMMKTSIPAETGSGTSPGVSSIPVSANGTKVMRIDDVRAFKACLQLSLGPQPVRKLSDFEDNEAKL
jgi:insulysin